MQLLRPVRLTVVSVLWLIAAMYLTDKSLVSSRPRHMPPLILALYFIPFMLRTHSRLHLSAHFSPKFSVVVLPAHPPCNFLSA